MTNAHELIGQLDNELRVLRVRTSALVHVSELRSAVKLMLEAAGDTLGTPLAAVNLIDADKQLTVAAVGLQTGPVNFDASYCQHVVVGRQSLAIEDSIFDPLVADNLATTRDGLRAYLGVPLITSDRLVIGALCVCETRPRKWSSDDLSNLIVIAGRLMQLEAEVMDTLRYAQGFGQ